MKVFVIRGTQMVGRDFFALDGVQDEADGDVLGSFLKQFYESAVYVPKHVVVPFPVPESGLIAEWLTERRGSKVDVAAAQRGVRRRMTDLATGTTKQSLHRLIAGPANRHKLFPPSRFICLATLIMEFYHCGVVLAQLSFSGPAFPKLGK